MNPHKANLRLQSPEVHERELPALKINTPAKSAVNKLIKKMGESPRFFS